MKFALILTVLFGLIITLKSECLPIMEKAELEKENISQERRETLLELAKAISEAEDPKLVFICTHNSRRSHLAQVKMAEAANKFGIKLETYSGGTEATAFNDNARNALVNAGFEIKETERLAGENNKIYELAIGDKTLELFSKKFSDPTVPHSGIIAVMVCSDADKNCPYVPGADERFAIPYSDPKSSDGSGKEEEVYGERLLQIASEMLFVAEHIKRK
ncbi:MAG: hypothetical protein Kapaf2KO_09060 [Candidatus Kapaibacteriales bacterium]